MDAIALHLEIRNAFSLADELGRHEHALGNDTLAGHLAAARTALGELERDVGRSHRDQVSPNPTLIERLERSLHALRERSEEIPVVLRPRVGQLLSAIERVVFAELRPSSPVPAKLLFGKLPLKRVISQDVHSVMDYLAASAYLVSAKLAFTKRGRVVGLALGSSVAGVSLLTDYRLSAVKVIPIEVHELLDHASGGSAALAPLLLGYVRTDPIAAAIQIVTGLGTIVASLFTDYRAARGVGRALRSKGGPRARRLPRGRVPEAQRPLEGFAGPSYIPRAEI
jgi:hypothetical protein